MNLIEEVKKLAEHKCTSPRDGYVLGIDYYIEKHQFDKLIELITTNEANRVQPEVSLPSRYILDDIRKYSDGWWITFWSEATKKRIKNVGSYKTKNEARAIMEYLNSKARSN